MRSIRFTIVLILTLSTFVSPARALAEGGFVGGLFGQVQAGGGAVHGKIILADGGTPLHNVIVNLVQLKRSTETGDDGAYEFQNVPPGTYTVLAHMEGFPDQMQQVRVTAGGSETLDFTMRLVGLKEEVTVTATGSEQSVFDSFQSVNTVDALKLAQESHTSIGEVLDKEPGVAKRNFGPGSARPVVRGFDGDRVLVTQDGASTGSLASQSADHAEPIDVLSLERLEVVKGPATLLYGSSATGGVVNAVTGHDFAHEGWRGYFTGVGGTTNNQGGASGGLEYGTGKWMFWGNGTLQRTGDYNTPIGRIEQSFTREKTGTLGVGHYGDKNFVSFTYGYDQRRYGIPFATFFETGGAETGSDVSINARRHDFKFNGGWRDLDGFVNGFRLTLDYSDYAHNELEGETVGTRFTNKNFMYRGVFDQRKTGRFSGSFGFAGFHRDYKSIGAEALAPPTLQNNFAVFGLEEIDFERVRFQLGGRVERNGYNPDGALDRSFTGFSGAAGVRVGLWKQGAFVANYSHSYRAPALEELYNNGPHVGNLTFEIGNPQLRRERNDGLDLSLRHDSKRVRGVANFYYYNIKDFVFLAPTGNINENLIEALYDQADSRFKGTELNLDFAAHENLWVNLGYDYVNAQLKETGTPLPRIPPQRARVGLDWRYKAFDVKPEATLVKDQDRIFPTETRTAGYALFDLSGSYTIAHPHYAQVFSVSAFNLGDRLYRNHLSFIKDLAPEIGRGLRFSYTIRYF
ncbi:MAG: iron complex outerrane recepter protein [Acidobacteriota bacterium]|nr:iron complex outerrane recepter protein [Acidobacteriota bacterium]